MPGHAENISSAAKINLDVAGIRVIGLGTGNSRPKLSWTAAAGYVEVNAANVKVENLVFDVTPGAGKSAVAGVSLFTGCSMFELADCSFYLNDGPGQCQYVINAVAGGTNTQIRNCEVLGGLDSKTGVSGVVYVSGPQIDYFTIDATKIHAYSTTQALVKSTSTCTGFQIKDSEIVNGVSFSTAPATKCIETASGVTGWLKDVVYGNFSGVTLITAAPITASPL
jgi:hypothetical protein